MLDARRLGLGRMGSALATALVRRGYDVTVWNRSARPTPAETKRAETLGEAFEADVVVTCLSTCQDQQPLLGKNIKVLVNLTSGTPHEARATAKWAQDNGIEYVDGVLMAVPQQIGTPHARILFSGSENHRVLDVFGEPVYVGGDAGLAALYDAALLGAAGIEPEQFTPMATEWLTSVGRSCPVSGKRCRTGST